ncbi:MAG: trypsin-like peptidase domain-containing protein [Caulobacteraceae bacterium]
MAPKNTGIIVGAVAAAGVAAAALAGVSLRLPEASAENAKPKLIQTAGPSVFAPPPGAPLSFADIFDRVAPAVVSINVTAKVERRGIPGFENFPFDAPRGQGQGQGQGQGGRGGRGAPGGGRDGDDDDNTNTAMASGSGFFISPDGYIVTNNHVVENATDIKVVMKDERELSAKVIGRDESTDLAVIKVEGKNFAFVNFENSARPRVGDWVLAVGNPFGLGGTRRGRAGRPRTWPRRGPRAGSRSAGRRRRWRPRAGSAPVRKGRRPRPAACLARRRRRGRRSAALPGPRS